MSPAIWFITGASAGIGLAMTKQVLSQGDIAIATVRKPSSLKELADAYSPTQLHVLKLDVSIPSDIISAFAEAQKVFGRIDVVFSNAGYGTLGEVESTPEDLARKMFDTNFWGGMGVAREAIRFFREVNGSEIGGRLIAVSSVVGIASSPGLAYYVASKHALEGAIESFAKELDPKWNIEVTIIEPGAFQTRGSSPESLVQTTSHPAYADPKSTVSFIRGYINNTPLSGDTDKVVKVIHGTIARLEDPPVRIPLGKDAITAIRQQVKGYLEDIEKYEALSDDLLLEGRELMTHLEK